MLYPGSRIEPNGLMDREGKKINIIGTPVKVKVPVASVTMSDDLEEGDLTGHIISLIYKGDHYHYVVRTKSGADFHLHDKDLWNEEDHVSISVPAERIQLSLEIMEEQR
ncbi:TOBE domain-containing protein [Anoxybacterium hadale]|uniref:TOBE domain-containing protein n=1 Tax=Anoxybacterium hadale TaxID=3408580 RepID=UPI003AFFE542